MESGGAHAACSFRLAPLRRPSKRRICAPVIEALRTNDHHDNEDRGKQHVAPLRAAAEKLRQEREDGRPEQWPDNALRAAEQHVEHDRDRQRDREVLRLDVAEVMRVKPSPDAGDGRAEREGGNLERAHVEAHQVGDALVVMDRGDRNAKARRKQQPHQHRDAERKHRDRRQADERRDRIAGRAADHIEIEDRRPHDLAQREGGEREINAARPQHRDRHRQPDEARGDAAQGNRDQRRQRQLGAEIGRGIAADRGKAGDTEIELAGRDRQERGVGVNDIDRQQHQHAFEIAAHARAPALAPPNRPVGRTIRMNSSRP